MASPSSHPNSLQPLGDTWPPLLLGDALPEPAGQQPIAFRTVAPKGKLPSVPKATPPMVYSTLPSPSVAVSHMAAPQSVPSPLLPPSPTAEVTLNAAAWDALVALLTQPLPPHEHETWPKPLLEALTQLHPAGVWLCLKAPFDDASQNDWLLFAQRNAEGEMHLLQEPCPTETNHLPEPPHRLWLTHPGYNQPLGWLALQPSPKSQTLTQQLQALLASPNVPLVLANGREAFWMTRWRYWYQVQQLAQQLALTMPDSNVFLTSMAETLGHVLEAEAAQCWLAPLPADANDDTFAEHLPQSPWRLALQTSLQPAVWQPESYGWPDTGLSSLTLPQQPPQSLAWQTVQTSHATTLQPLTLWVMDWPFYLELTKPTPDAPPSYAPLGVFRLWRTTAPNQPYQWPPSNLSGSMSRLMAQALPRLWQLERALALANIDELTGLTNRRGFYDRFELELERAHRHGKPLCVALLDVDHFKHLNDTFGHLEGDRVLVELSRLMQATIRKTDLVARFGGEEFALLLPEILPNDAAELMERLRQTIAQHNFNLCTQTEGSPPEAMPVTISGGITPLAQSHLQAFLEANGQPKPQPSRWASLISRTLATADTALYQAKHDGRNRMLFSHLNPTTFTDAP
jgi:diguanylate cyclase (GGDEF)-like protein